MNINILTYTLTHMTDLKRTKYNIHAYTYTYRENEI